MKFFAVLIALALTIPSFAQSDSIALLEKKLDQMQYQFYVLQSKVNIIDQDLNSFKNVSSDSIKLLMQKNEVIALRVDENGAKVDKQEMSIEMLEKTQHTQGGLLENFLWIVALGFLVIAALFILSFIHQRRKLNSQRELLERLFMDNLRTLESELKEITAANRQKSITLETEINKVKEESAFLQESVSKNISKAEIEHAKLEEAILSSDKELSKNLGILKQKITKNDKKFMEADKALADSVKKNEKLLKEKIEKLKSSVKKENEALLKKLNSELKKNTTKVNELQKEVQKNQKRKTVTFRVKKSS
jgi:hypothetical protein